MKEHDSQGLERLKNQIKTAGGPKLGTSDGKPFYDLDPLHGSQYIKKARRVGEIRQNIAERTLPNLDVYAQLSQRQQDYQKITEMVEQGYLPKNTLDRARQEIDDIKSNIIK